MGELLIIPGVIFLFAAGYQHLLALREVQRILPEHLSDEETASWAFDTWIWNSIVPASARRQYLRAMIFASISFASIAGTVLAYGDRIPTLLFAGLSVLAAVLAFWRWFKHRGQF